MPDYVDADTITTRTSPYDLSWEHPIIVTTTTVSEYVETYIHVAGSWGPFDTDDGII